MPIEELLVKPRPGQNKNEMTEDDLPKQNPFYSMVDERAFRSVAEHEAKGWQQRSVREMIDICARIERQFESPSGPKELVENYLVALDGAAAAKAEVAALQESVKAHVCPTGSVTPSTPDNPDADGNLDNKSHSTWSSPARDFGRGRRSSKRDPEILQADTSNPAGNQANALINAGHGHNTVRLSYAAVLRQGLPGRNDASLNGAGRGRGSGRGRGDPRNGGLEVPFTSTGCRGGGEP